jgi:hypothetical protein
VTTSRTITITEEAALVQTLPVSRQIAQPVVCDAEIPVGRVSLAWDDVIVLIARREETQRDWTACRVVVSPGLYSFFISIIWQCPAVISAMGSMCAPILHGYVAHVVGYGERIILVDVFIILAWQAATVDCRCSRQQELIFSSPEG